MGLAVALILASSSSAAWAQTGTVSARDADAFIRRVFAVQDTGRYDEATSRYYDLLEGAVAVEESDDEEVLRHYLRYACSVMPPAERPTIRWDESGPGEWGDAPGAVAAWWRRQDPLPGTLHNERLEEHLSRIAYASAHFSGDASLEVDERGETFIRLGAPSLRMNVRLNEVVRAFDVPSTVRVPDLPENELWIYEHVHDEAQYFFLKLSGREPFKLASPNEMIPNRLIAGLGQSTERGRERTDVALLVLEEVYAQLALAHPVYGSTFDRIAQYRGLPPSSSSRPELFVRSVLSDASAREMDILGHRESVVPVAHSNVNESIETLPVEMRWARFLQPDGSTRVEIYWQIPPASIRPSERRLDALDVEGYSGSDLYLVSISAMRSASDYRTRSLTRRYYRARPDGREALPTQTFVVESDADTVHLGIQWDVHWAEESGTGLRPYGPTLRRRTAGIDSVVALHGRGEQLEVSDLKPVVGGADHPTASDRIDPSAPPQLYFELYNLHFGPDDRTRYSIEYEIIRDGGLVPARTAAVSRNSGTERTTQERIGIELEDDEASDSITLRIRATDEVTGEQAARSIRFELGR